MFAHLQVGKWQWYIVRQIKRQSINAERSKCTDLTDVHAGVTAERPDCGQIVGFYQSRNDAILIHLTDHGGIHEVHEPVLIYSNACR